MKKLVILIVFVFVTAAFTAAQAEVRAGAVSYGMSAGGYFFEGNQDYQDTVTLGLRAGYNFTENFGSEIFVNWVPSKFKDYRDGETNKVYVAGIEGLYHFLPRNRFVPYLALGIGAIHYTSNDNTLKPSKFIVDYGVGIKYFLTDDLSLRTDIRHVLPLGDSLEYGNNPHYVHNDLMATIGISYDFEGVKEEPYPKAKEPVKEEVIGDADKDGVPDNIDKCPDTPLGSEVDQFGCPPDADQDGVPDIMDKCPGTPASVVVDKFGCPLDSDGDGVPDYLDKCQGTPAGVAIDKDGCPPDSDKDGVPDYLDKCPDTPTGETVDKDGCIKTINANVSILLKVEFDSGKSFIKKKYHQEIKTVAVFMKEHPEATATIVGHTDNIGHRKANIMLSKARANSIRQYLIDKFGIEGFRIKSIGHGPDKPLASNSTKEGRQKNRRIVALIETSPIK